ncbi:hypothetical protein [Tissierella praeacuta]|jgi:hypothetical protein|uniref:hypothetical protein n=1 Tax=Tissierella praeacuta TaxID=43131 RepID=UPI002FD974F2
MFKNKIWVEEGFQTSVNIAYDLNNENKIKNFIPTIASMDVIEEVLLSTSSSANSRSRILIGAYGKGKSHIILVLMSLLYRKKIDLFEVLLNRIKSYNLDLYNYAVNYIESDKKLLPVIISGSSASLTQSFLGALEQSLKHEDLLNLMPKTNFMSAITTIELWENSYPETYRKFGESIDVNIDEFILSLKEFDVLAYEHFNELFPKLTSGAIFNPFVNVDVVELYEDVANKLKEYGYNGIYIIYDEFSKYLESSIDNATISDIKLLQDFAEKCDRSGEQQMHLMLISHKDISNYIDNKLPKEKVDGWRGVSGRFKHINLHNNFSQMYEIMATVIKKDNKFWSQFTEKNKICFRSLMDRYKENNLFDNFDLNTAIMDCYPLHPISTFILPRLSEKVAQNERTLFTFLSSDNKYTLNEFLRKSNTEFPILTPDYIYDYFEPLFRKEIYTSDIYKIYSLTSKVLRRLENDSLSSKIIKTIALIYMVEQFEKLPPTHSMIVDAYIETVPDILEINNTLKELIEKDCIVYLKRSNGYLKIKESSGVDIFSEIKKVIEKNEENISVKKILNETHLDSYMYPTAYNDEMEITRYFDFKFIDSEEFYAVENWERKIESFDSVGVVYAIIPKDLVDIKNIRANITSDNNGHSRLLFVLPKTFIDIGKIVYEYYAVEQLKTNAVDDEMLFDEYDIILEDLEEVISKFIGRYTRPEMNESEYFYKGKKMPFKRKAHISTKLSEICYETYPHTPVINNETINKDIITTAALNSRNKVISGLLENNLDVNLGLRGTGQDISFMRSTLIRTGILLDEEKNPKLTLSPSDDKIRKLLIIIQNFFTESSNVEGKNFKELYDMLILPQYGYGIKKGVIPIYIAVVMHSFKKYMVVKTKDNEINISVDLLNSINETPEKFTVYLEDWSEEKTNYIEMLSELFSDYIIEREKDYNTFSYVVFAMSRWYMDLPKYARTLKAIYKGKNASGDLKLSKSQMKFINSLKNPDINAREYLFKDLVKIFDYSEFSINIVDNLKSAKLQFDNAKTELIKQLIIDVKIIFSRTSNNINASLSSVIKDYIESLKSQTLIHLYPNGEDKILSLMKTISNDEVMFIERLGKAVTDLRINDWNRETVTIFITELESFKKSIEEFDRNVTISNINTGNNTQGYKISFLDENGNEIVKTFDKIEYSNRAKLLYNEIANALEEMGQSISEGEKRQILMAFIEKMC